MKAKDIALLCTAAAGAGAAAGAVVTTARGGDKKTPPRRESKNAPVKKKAAPEKSENIRRAEISSVEFPDGLEDPRLVCSHSDSGLAAAVFGDGKDCRTFILRPLETDGACTDVCAEEIRCPGGVTDAAVSADCAFFITPRGGVSVYSDPDREPVMCGLTDPEYVCSIDGKFYVFSDSLLYICTDSGEIGKTVSLGALIDITGSDICDAESTDGGFSSARVSVKKMLPLGKGGFAAVLTSDGRSFLMNSEDGEFFSFEKTYDNIFDVCVFGGYAYYLCGLKDGYGIIKTRISDKKCETMAKFFLCGPEDTPVKLYGGIYGIGVLFADGTVKFLLPEISSEKRREKCRKELKILGDAFESVRAEDIFTLGNSAAYLSGGKIYIVT